MFGKKEEKTSQYNTPEENALLIEIESAQQYAEGGKRYDIETAWDDEYKVYIGGGKQWDTTKGKRTEKGKRRNFNSEDNFILPMVQNMLAPFSNTPVMNMSGVEPGDNESAEVLNDLVPHILYRNKFPEQWEKITEQFVSYGPAIGYVGYDQHWIGGTGPDRWVGEIVSEYVKKEEFFPDPSILDLEERLQECSYINRVKRKKIEWFKEMWPKKGQYVLENIDSKIKGQEDEGQDPKQAALIIHYHKGVPKFVPDEWKKIFLEKAQEAEQNNQLPYYAKDLRDMAAGTLKGVHCAYKSNNVLLDYIPYIYDDGMYPFVYKVLYYDKEQPYGMGEIRNVLIPQLLHNKADEIELGAMLGQGLGGGFYNKGALSNAQRDELLDNIAKPNAWHEVNTINGIVEKKATTTPPSITNYKDSKKHIIDTVSGNTAILQGISPGANVPYSTIAELGARADARTRRKAKVLERFMIEFVQLIINRIAQFYTEDRKYRILGDNQLARMQSEVYKALTEIASMPAGTDPNVQLQALVDILTFIKTQQEKPKTAVFKRDMLVKTWERDVGKKEEFIPEFDVRVKVTDEKPTDRNYYTSLATQLFGKAIGLRAFWKTMDEGRFPPIDEIISEIEDMQKSQAESQMQAQMAMVQAEQADKQADREASMQKQRETNQSQIEMTALSAAAKAGVR